MKVLTFLLLFTMFDPLMLVLFFILALGLSSILLVFIVKFLFLWVLYLFMLFMSGIVILLAYMCGVIIIEKVSSIYKFYLTFIWILILISLFTQFIKFDFIYFHIFITAIKINYYEFYFIFKFMLFPFNMLSIFFIIYLLLCLVIIYEIIKKCSGPLRMKI
uniref:NADH dehydrogenase subunit 6 n=1 Tax=Bemisia tabaci TaxID=7038 RepID=A0A678NM17_BEMTA|nr:NADH dehydrogenase subunit 6 [Bemisia tabaci]